MSTVTVELTHDELLLIDYLIAHRPTTQEYRELILSLGDTHVGMKVTAALVRLTCQ